MANRNQQIVAGSLGAIAQKSGESLASSFLNVECIAMVDTSGSMGAHDAQGEQTRYEAACKELERLQAENAGKIGVCCFSDWAQFCPGGVPQYLGSGTDMVKALRMLKMADGTGIRLILISDGAPDEPEAALAEARKFSSKIDTIYIGPESGIGRDFLYKLSQATGGISITNAAADLGKGKLSDNITKLIGSGA